MAKTKPKKTKKSGRKKKKPDENICESCGNIVKESAYVCPKCGVRNCPKGSIGWLIFWIIVFWPAAIIYFFIRRWD